MLMSMAYLDQILPVLSTVEAVEVTRRASVRGPGLPKTLPTDVASPCVFTVSEKLVAVYICTACVSVLHAYLYCMRVSRVYACVFLVHRRGFSTLVLFILEATTVTIEITGWI